MRHISLYDFPLQMLTSAFVNIDIILFPVDNREQKTHLQWNVS